MQGLVETAKTTLWDNYSIKMWLVALIFINCKLNEKKKMNDRLKSHAILFFSQVKSSFLILLDQS
jgi:hypothetical protein